MVSQIWIINLDLLYNHFQQPLDLLKIYRDIYIIEIFDNLCMQRKIDLIKCYIFIFKGLISESVFLIRKTKLFLNRLIKIDV